MAKYKVTVKYGDPGKSKNSSQLIYVDAGNESTAIQLAISKFKNSNPAYRNKDAEAVKVEEV